MLLSGSFRIPYPSSAVSSAGFHKFSWINAAFIFPIAATVPKAGHCLFTISRGGLHWNTTRLFIFPSAWRRHLQTFHGIWAHQCKWVKLSSVFVSFPFIFSCFIFLTIRTFFTQLQRPAKHVFLSSLLAAIFVLHKTIQKEFSRGTTKNEKWRNKSCYPAVSLWNEVPIRKFMACFCLSKAYEKNSSDNIGSGVYSRS